MSLILDAGGFIAIERADRETIALIKHELLEQRTPRTHGGVVAQVWRGGSRRQSNLARFLPCVHVEPLDDQMGRRAGLLLGRARTSDVVDAAVVLLAADGDVVLTSDPADLVPLAAAAGLHIDIVPV